MEQLPTLSIYAGAQVGTVYYRMSTDGGSGTSGAAPGVPGSGSQDSEGSDGGVEGMFGFAYGFQVGAIGYLGKDFILRLEAAWLHAGEATTESGDTTYGTDAMNFLSLQLGIGYLFY